MPVTHVEMLHIFSIIKNSTMSISNDFLKANS